MVSSNYSYLLIVIFCRLLYHASGCDYADCLVPGGAVPSDNTCLQS